MKRQEVVMEPKCVCLCVKEGGGARGGDRAFFGGVYSTTAAEATVDV